MNQPHSERWQQRRKLAHWRAQKTCPTNAHSHSQTRGTVSAQSFFHGLKPMGYGTEGGEWAQGRGWEFGKWAVREKDKNKEKWKQDKWRATNFCCKTDFYCKTGYLLLSMLKYNKKRFWIYTLQTNKKCLKYGYTNYTDIYMCSSKHIVTKALYYNLNMYNYYVSIKNKSPNSKSEQAE